MLRRGRVYNHAFSFCHTVPNKDGTIENGDNSVLTDQCDGTV